MSKIQTIVETCDRCGATRTTISNLCLGKDETLGVPMFHPRLHKFHFDEWGCGHNDSCHKLLCEDCCGSWNEMVDKFLEAPGDS